MTKDFTTKLCESAAVVHGWQWYMRIEYICKNIYVRAYFYMLWGIAKVACGWLFYALIACISKLWEAAKVVCGWLLCTLIACIYKLWEAAKVVCGWLCTLKAYIYKKTRRISRTEDLPRNYEGMWLPGKVARIDDGDGFKFFHCPCPWFMRTTYTSEDSKLPVRLAGIDAPEMGYPDMEMQPFAKESKRYLESLIKGKMIRIKLVGIDQYNRVLAFAYLPGWFSDTNVNLEMVKSGLARVYTGQNAKYDEYEERLKSEEENARMEKRGLWKHPNPMSPMEYKRKHRKKFSKKNNK